MKLSNLVAGTLLTALLMLEAWTLNTVIDLKVQVAKLDARLSAIPASKLIATK